MRFYTTERLSANRELTPEGYLLCKDVPLARTGTMLYGPGETPIKPAKGSQAVRIHRRPEDVFCPTSLASYAGKPFCDDHPEDDVTPKNWKDLTKGIVFTPHQGVGDQADVVLGDILITDPATIELVKDNEKVEISAGYDADYEEVAPGEGYQKNIIINHVALVADGRCGPRCRIGDTANPKERKSMNASIYALLHRAFKAKDAGELEQIANEADPGAGGEGGEHHVHVHLGGGAKAGGDEEGAGMPPPGGAPGGGAGGGDMETRMAAMEAALQKIMQMLSGGNGAPAGDPDPAGDKAAKDAEEAERVRKEMEDDETVTGLGMEAPPGTEDKARNAKDSAYLADAWQVLVSQVEIIVPGARFPTFDSAARPAVTFTKICGMRVETLDRAYQNAKLAPAIDAMNGGRKPDFAKMTCDAARIMIASVAREAGRLNNAGVQDTDTFGSVAARQGTLGGGGVKGKMLTPADLNAAARKLYNRV